MYRERLSARSGHFAESRHRHTYASAQRRERFHVLEIVQTVVRYHGLAHGRNDHVEIVRESEIHVLHGRGIGPSKNDGVPRRVWARGAQRHASFVRDGRSIEIEPSIERENRRTESDNRGMRSQRHERVSRRRMRDHTNRRLSVRHDRRLHERRRG